MIRLILFFFVSLLLTGPSAANTWTDCNGNTSPELYRIAEWGLTCLDFTDAAGADPGVDSRVFFVAAKTALICFDPGDNTEGVDVATINIRYCPNGPKPAATPENFCGAITTAVITGIQGSASTQDACQRVGPGAYYIEVVNDGAAGDASRVTIQGEGD